MEHAAVPSMNREERLSQWVESYSDAILRTCFLYLSDQSQAEDAPQDTWIKAWRRMGEYERNEILNDKAWLMRIAINTCKDMLRSSWMRRIDKRKPIEELPLSTSYAPEESLALTQAVMSLPPKLKDIVLLHYYQDMNLRTCAEVLGISGATATRWLQKAQAKIRKELERS